MAALEINAASSICRKCGTAYSRLKGYFPVSYSYLYKGTGYLPYCRDCVDGMYQAYLVQCNDPKKAVRQMCRKLDLYWNERVFDMVEKQNAPKSMMTSYIAKANSVKLASKSYDDTLIEENALWLAPKDYANIQEPEPENEVTEEIPEVPEEVIAFWGPGNTPQMYWDLEQRRQYWMTRLGEVKLDIGAEALIRQICTLEIDINRDRAAGKPADKNINTLNTLLGSASLKPAQKKADEFDVALANTPMGVWLHRYENLRPLPEIDPSLQDVNGLKKYIFTWMGHLCKMMGIKNGYTKMYEQEVERLRVAKPEYFGEDDETLLTAAYSETNDGGDGS